MKCNDIETIEIEVQIVGSGASKAEALSRLIEKAKGACQRKRVEEKAECSAGSDCAAESKCLDYAGLVSAIPEPKPDPMGGFSIRYEGKLRCSCDCVKEETAKMILAEEDVIEWAGGGE